MPRTSKSIPADDWSGKPVTPRQMLRWVRSYEKIYFNSERLVLGIEIKHKLPQIAFLGLFSFIEISDDILRSEKLVRILLLHELIHSKHFLQSHRRDEKQEHGHGPRFRAEIKRLMSAGAYDKLL
jgi:SprT-like family